MKQLMTLLLLVPFFLMAQNPGSPEYEQMKLNGQIPIPEQAVSPAVIPTPEQYDGGRSTGFFLPLDGSFTQSMVRNDDGSSGVISIPFNFCFYGTTYTTLHINNNGNLTFDGPYGSFTSTGFPMNRVIIAPFWADVDTRGIPTVGTNLVWHKVEANRITVIWDHVGYFPSAIDKLNTFQVIITDGNDPLIGIGKNVAFAFEDMQWTTGGASGGSGGLGGTPATVGVNKGDGTNFSQVGRFNQAGDCYNGPSNNPPYSCVGFLTGKRYVFDACQENIIIEPPVPVSNWALYIGIFMIVAFTVIRFRKMI